MADTTTIPVKDNASRRAKNATVAELAEAFEASNAALLTEYRGLTVAQLTELRHSLGSSARYTVAKNNLTKLAADKAGVEGVHEFLTGPTAVAFVTGDPGEAAKGLKNFAKENDKLVIKGGVMDGAPLTPEQINKLADLESREVLLAKLAGGMKAGIAKAAAVLQAPLSKMARTTQALADKKANEE